MFCRKCGKELHENSLICDQCGENNTTEIIQVPAKQGFPWVPVLATVGCIALALLLAWVVYFGVTGRFTPKKNDVHYKESYTVDDQTAIANRNTVVATMGEDTLTNGQLQVLYSWQVVEYINQYGSSYFDYNKPLDDQIYDKDSGLTWQQFFMEAAINTWKQYQIVANKAADAGFQLSAEYQADLDGKKASLEKIAKDNGFVDLEAFVTAQLGAGCTFEDYMHCLRLNYFSSAYYEKLASEIEVSMEELEAYFAKNEATLAQYQITKTSGILPDIRQIYIKPDGSTKGPDGKTVVYSEVEFAAARAEIQSLLDQWLAGEKTAESFAKLATEKSEDLNTKKDGGLYAYVYRDDFTEIDVRHILFMPENGTTDASGKTTYSDAEWAACLEKAQSVLNTFKEGEQTEARFAELAKEHSKDGNASVGGIYMDVPRNYMVKPFEAWIFDEGRQYGDTDIVKTDFGYHVMYFVHRDDAIDQWIFADDREAGDYEILRSDDGWHLVYYVDGEEGWKRLSRSGVLDEKSTKLLDELLVGYEIETNYKNIVLSEIDL